MLHQTTSPWTKARAWRPTQHQFAFLAISPVEQPDVDLALAWSREGAAAAVDLGRQVDKWQG
ncbi:MAG: hypothetical protein ABW063_09180, partial [Caulobacter sp.]